MECCAEMSIDQSLGGDDDDSLVGEEVGSRYAITEILGEGGMATVYGAFDHVEAREVALKVMLASMAKETSLRRRFHNEAQATMSIVDLNVVEIIDFGELEDGRPFYVMERLDGLPLDEYADGRRLPLAEVLRIGTQICQGLSAAHGKGVIHRDLKPENVFVELVDGGCIKVLDFGVAKVSSAAALTLPGAVFGTPCYMSPEQAVPRREVDHRSDIYSLGIILYELLTGELPFSCEDPMQVLLSHIGQPPEPVCKRRPDVPSAVGRVVDRCLMKKAEQRFDTMDALRGALEAAALAPLDDPSVPEIHVEEILAPTVVDKTILFDRSKMTVAIHELVEAPAPVDSSWLVALPTDRPAEGEAAIAHVVDADRLGRLPTPPGPQPWRPTARLAPELVWSALVLLPVLLVVVYAVFG